MQVIDAGSPEHMATMTAGQLRVLAASKRPEHIMAGYAAALELVKRGETLPATLAGPRRSCSCGTAWADEPGHDDAGKLDAATERILAELAAHGYSGAVNILMEQGVSAADAAQGVLGVIPRTVEEQIRAKVAG